MTAGRNRPWTEQELMYLRENHHVRPREEIAEALGRTANSVRAMGLRLRLDGPKRQAHKHWTPEEHAKMLELSEGHTAAQIAEKLGRSWKGVVQYMRLHGVRHHNDMYTFNQLMKLTGYAKSQLLRAKRALNQKWVRAAARQKRYYILVSYEQMEALTEYLKTESGDRKLSSLDERLWKQVDRAAGPLACWPFQGSGHSFWIGLPDGTNTHQRPARVAWRLMKGEVPENSQLRRTCPNKKCVNPAHYIVLPHKHWRKKQPSAQAA